MSAKTLAQRSLWMDCFRVLCRWQHFGLAAETIGWRMGTGRSLLCSKNASCNRLECFQPSLCLWVTSIFISTRAKDQHLRMSHQLLCMCNILCVLWNSLNTCSVLLYICVGMAVGGVCVCLMCVYLCIFVCMCLLSWETDTCVSLCV